MKSDLREMIEVTPAMVEAGLSVVVAWCIDMRTLNDQELVTAIYRVMRERSNDLASPRERDFRN